MSSWSLVNIMYLSNWKVPDLSFSLEPFFFSFLTKGLFGRTGRFLSVVYGSCLCSPGPVVPADDTEDTEDTWYSPRPAASPLCCQRGFPSRPCNTFYMSSQSWNLRAVFSEHLATSTSNMSRMQPSEPGAVYGLFLCSCHILTHSIAASTSMNAVANS